MGVVGIVGDVPCYGVGGMTHVAAGVRSPCVRSLAPRPGFERGVDCARGRGSGVVFDYAQGRGSVEAQIALEA